MTASVLWTLAVINRKRWQVKRGRLTFVYRCTLNDGTARSLRYVLAIDNLPPPI